MRDDKLRGWAWMAVVTLAVSTAACDKAPAEAPAEVPAKAAKPEKKPFLAGEVRLGDERKRVEPFIAHGPEMDLRVQCKLMVDKAKEEKAKDPTLTVPELCFEEAFTLPPTTVRVEHTEGLATPQALRYLRERAEAAHFLIEKTGTLYQTLDAGYPARRDGAYRKGEIRILSGKESSHDMLLGALKSAVPGLKVEVVAGPPIPAAPAKPEKKAEPADAP